jgi:hypothetical protein
MHLVKILFVLSAVILLAGTVICAHSIGVSVTLGKLDLQAPEGNILTADGGSPVPRPWRSIASQQSALSILTADGGSPVPRPWRGIAS